MAEILTKVTGRQFKLRTPSREETKKEFPALSSDELLDMSRWFNEYGTLRSDEELKDISIAKTLYPNIATFEQYAYKNWNFDLLTLKLTLDLIDFLCYIMMQMIIMCGKKNLKSSLQ
ncbi:10533_t:CDS:2, partial [Dentiscutata erythropus]